MEITLTLADWTWIRVVPGAVGLASNDHLTPVVIPRVTYDHHYSVILVLSAIDQPPSPMFNSRVADVGAGHRWKVKGQTQIIHINTYLCLVRLQWNCS